MDPLKKNSVYLKARLETFVVPGSTYGQPSTRFSNVEGQLKVDDAFIREQHPGFDRLERPFLLLPRDGEGTIWQRHELSGRPLPAREGFLGEIPVDSYDVSVKAVDPGAIRTHGIAVGLETNIGTLWAQAPGANAFPNPALEDTFVWR